MMHGCIVRTWRVISFHGSDFMQDVHEIKMGAFQAIVTAKLHHSDEQHMYQSQDKTGISESALDEWPLTPT